MTFCHREVIHAQWKVLLDDDFIEAWQHGFPVLCSDGIRRRFYIRIFSHSGDYPEKCVFVQSCGLFLIDSYRILLASIRNLGTCPCPRCLIPLSRVHNLGMPRDMAQRFTMARIDNNTRQGKVTAARRLVYEKGYIVSSAAIEGLLKDESLVPTAVCSSS